MNFVSTLALFALTQTTTTTTTTPDDFRKTQPAAGPERAFVVPAIQTAVVPGTKLEVVLVEDHTLPAVQLRVAFPDGGVSDPKGKAGLASLCARLANEGPKRLDKVAWETALADLASTVELGAGAEQSSLSLRSLKETFLPTLDLAVELIAAPGLRDDDLKRVRDRQLAQLAQQRGSAAGIAARLQPLVTWGSAHPLGTLTSEASLGAVSVDDCGAFFKGLRPDGARVFVAGDVTLKEVTDALAERVTRFGWTGKAKEAAPMAAAKLDQKSAVDSAPVVLVDVPGAEQSVVVVVGAGPARQAADYDATSVMSAVLGGGFSSRINMNLREKNGFTYGARAGFGYWKKRGAFSLSSSIRTDATGAALKEIDGELVRMRSTPITDVELARERDGSLLAFPSAFATSSSTLDAWSATFFYGLPKDTLQKTPARLKALNQKALEAAAKAHVPQQVRLLVVGDAARIAKDVEAFAAGGAFGQKKGQKNAVVVVDADGRVVVAAP